MEESYNQYAYLFGNGRPFKMKHPDLGSFFKSTNFYVDESDIGFIPETKDWDIEWRSVKDCTLIARPITDLLDSEMDLFDYHNKYKLAALAGSGRLPFELGLRMIQVGVYPFDNAHFGLPDDHVNKVIKQT